MSAQEMAGSSSGKGNGGASTPGFRFHPTDYELLSYYLSKKVRGETFFGFQPIAEIELYKYEPSDLPALSRLKSKDKVWYFFNAVDRKHGSGTRLNRATQKGYWKSTGKERSVKNMSKTIIGMKKTLVFHEGRAPDGKRTNWVIHEYRLVDEQLENALLAQDAFVVCKVFEKADDAGGEADHDMPNAGGEADHDMPNAGGEADHDTPNSDVPRIGFINEEEMPVQSLQKDKQKAPLFPEDSLDPQCQGIGFLSKRREESDDPEFLCLGLSKRPKQGHPNPSNGNGSEDSTNTVWGPKTSRSSNVLDSFNLEKSVPPGYLKLMNNLESDVLNVSVERDNLKHELSDAQKIIKTLLSHIEFLTSAK